MNDEFKKDLDFIQDIVDLRGFIINKTIIVETGIDTIIIYYFFKDNPTNAWEFHDDVIKTLNNNQKINLLKKVLLHFGENIKPNTKKRLFDLLNKIFDLRNKVAHYSWSGVWHDGVYLKKEKLKDEIIIGDNEIRSFIKNCREANALLNIILVV
ncbi:MAG TPA: hypothetical protein PLR01_04650, partial [Bacteroidales bacterium]|nr:hypothetical protein [Bacteroidales bacterium]